MLWTHSSDRAQLGDQPPTDEPQMAAADAAWPMLQNEFFLMRSFGRSVGDGHYVSVSFVTRQVITIVSARFFLIFRLTVEKKVPSLK